MEKLDVQQGGMSTSDWGVNTYGEMGKQQSIPGSNVVATHVGGEAGTNPVVPPIKGGEPFTSTLLSTEVLTPVVLTIASNQLPKLLRKSRKMRGGNMTSIAVPATLIIANQLASKRLGNRSSKKRYRRTRRR